jgi:hypothetical protein
MSNHSARPVDAPTVRSIATPSCDLHLRTLEKTSNCDQETTNIEKDFRILIKRQYIHQSRGVNPHLLISA